MKFEDKPLLNKFQYLEEPRKPRDEIFENNPLIKTTPFRNSETTLKTLSALIKEIQAFLLN